MIYSFKKGIRKQLTKNFNLSEIHCRGVGCCSVTRIDLNIVKLAQKMRRALAKSINVESGYRCTAHNRAVGGVNGSGHRMGTALDLSVSGVSRERLAVLAELLGVPRIGIYKTSNKRNMIHIGTGARMHWINTGNYLPTSHSFINGSWKKPLLKVSAKSNPKYIRYVQACLYAKGYKQKSGKLIVIDGVWGANTQYAVNKFRVSKGWKKANYLRKTGISALLK